MADKTPNTTNDESKTKTPRERFRTVAPARLQRARQAIKQVGLMGKRGYQFSSAEAERIITPLVNDLELAAKQLRDYAASGGEKQAKTEAPSFQFDD